MYLLQAFGHQVRGARDGAEGMEMAQQEPPDLILLDIHMPKMDGYEVARRLHEDPPCRSIPIVAVTALAMVGDREKLLSAGFQGYISKPIDPESFPGKVQEFLNRPGSPPPTPPPKARAEAAVPTAQKNAGIWRGRVLFVDNIPTNLELAKSILEPHGYEVLTASSVEQGIELARCHKPSLIVSDVHMPLHDGYYFMDLVQADRELCHIPFFFLTSSLGSARELERARAAGAVAVLTRPIDPETLLAELESCLHSQ